MKESNTVIKSSRVSYIHSLAGSRGAGIISSGCNLGLIKNHRHNFVSGIDAWRVMPSASSRCGPVRAP